MHIYTIMDTISLIRSNVGAKKRVMVAYMIVCIIRILVGSGVSDLQALQSRKRSVEMICLTADGSSNPISEGSMATWSQFVHNLRGGDLNNC